MKTDTPNNNSYHKIETTTADLIRYLVLDNQLFTQLKHMWQQ